MHSPIATNLISFVLCYFSRPLIAFKVKFPNLSNSYETECGSWRIEMTSQGHRAT